MEFFKALWNDIVTAFGDPIHLGTNTVTTLNIIVWSLFIGFIIAIGISVYNKTVVGSLVRGLISKKAFSEDSAVTAADVGCKNMFVRLALNKNSTLRRIVCAAGKNNNESVSLDSDKFYIPDSSQEKAEAIYSKNGVSIKNVLIAIVVLVLVAFAALYIVPDLIQMLSNFINGLQSESSSLL